MVTSKVSPVNPYDEHNLNISYLVTLFLHILFVS